MSIADGVDARAFNRMGRTDAQMRAAQDRRDRDMEQMGYDDALRVYRGNTDAELAYARREHQTRPGWRGDGPYERGMRRALDALIVGEESAS